MVTGASRRPSGQDAHADVHTVVGPRRRAAPAAGDDGRRSRSLRICRSSSRTSSSATPRCPTPFRRLLGSGTFLADPARFRRLIRGGVLLPFIVPTALSALVWLRMFGPL